MNRRPSDHESKAFVQQVPPRPLLAAHVSGSITRPRGKDDQEASKANSPRSLTWALCAPRGIRTPTARSIAWCSVSIWSAPDRSGLLTLDASSVQTAPEGSCRIVWMINRMIKPCDAAPSVTQTTAGTVERSPDIPSGDAWRTGARTAATPSSEQRIKDSGQPSTACWRVLSWQVRLGGPSSWWAPVMRHGAWWNDRRNDCETLRLLSGWAERGTHHGPLVWLGRPELKEPGARVAWSFIAVGFVWRLPALRHDQLACVPSVLVAGSRNG